MPNSQPSSQFRSTFAPPSRRRFLAIGGKFIGGVWVAGCGAIAPPSPGTPLTISAAASLQQLLRSLVSSFRKQVPNIQLSFNFGSSGALQRQIEQGAQVDGFLSASRRHMDALATQGLIVADSRRSLFKNQIALVTAPHIAGVKTFQDLAGDLVGTVAIGQPNSVPLGRYAKEVLDSLKLYKGIQSKLVYGKDARQVLTYVATGNVDAALVYRSDISANGPVPLVAVAREAWHSPIIYPGAAIADSPRIQATQTFLNFLHSSTAQKQIVAQGFQTLKNIEQR